MTEFPKNFIWAIATASYQVEGANDEDGRGLSIWDVIRRQPGRIADDSPPELSCEHYHHYKEDVQLIKDLQVTHYRLSICWSRILPKGDLSVVNEKGITFYRSLLEELTKNGISPIVTLFHADYPYCLYERGGWLNDECLLWFHDFCRLCFQRFGDLVKHWITFNELSAHAWWGITKIEGQLHHSPDTVEFSMPTRKIPYAATHNMLLAHAKVYRMYAQEFKETQQGQLGITVGGRWCKTFSTDIDDIEAVSRALDWKFNWTVNPIFGNNGDYPDSMKSYIKTLEEKEGLELLPRFTKEQMNEIKGSADFLGLNYYLTEEICKGEGRFQMEKDAGFDYLEGSWEKIAGEQMWLRYAPEGLLELLEYIQRKYAVPVLITENGCSDIIGKESESIEPLNDDHRIRYIEGHIEAVKNALARGCNVIGYTVWSLMDNFEWHDGFAVRFGLYRVDYDSTDKKRTIKRSGRYLREFLGRVRNAVA
ncbi:unnamed protein product [Haemonchus placei]|uniref:Beta-glucosidase n=1 Tax=Haemonchus placei TaxID=6290 RepID=A0A158QP92_HAEPC|nr:unnamed protein product [Haemonchus placei]